VSRPPISLAEFVPDTNLHLGHSNVKGSEYVIARPKPWRLPAINAAVFTDGTTDDSWWEIPSPQRFSGNQYHLERFGPEKSACRKLSRGIQSIDNLARDWHTLIAGIFWAYRSYPLIADQQSLRLIQ